MHNGRFIWNEKKHEDNIKKHGVDFFEASTVFEDPNAISDYDFEHSHEHNEDRFIIIGTSLDSRLLLVCHCFRENGDLVRIISARKATRTEFKQYGGVR
ncbi:MAG: BrnT family toxin [Clostridiales bacterium]|jgi:uncharacterized DUF497 family protein|nr:BrnT family toxin [Clostridiales bacterium]